jgi:hypothetical protein
VTSLLYREVEGPVVDDKMSSFPPDCYCWQGTCRVGLRQRVGLRRGLVPGVDRSRPCGSAQRSCDGSGPLSLWTVSCCWGGCLVLMRGCDTLPHSRWGPGIGVRPHRRPPRRRVSPDPFKASSPTVTSCLLGGFSVGRDWWGGERVVGSYLC